MKINYILALLVCTFSCSNKKTQNANERKKEDIEKELVACDTLNDKPKLFLSFWNNMLDDDYYCIQKHLSKKGQIAFRPITNSFYYVINNDSLQILPTFENKKLVAITLTTTKFLETSYFKDEKYKSYISSSISIQKTALDIEKELVKKYGLPIKGRWISNTKYITFSSLEFQDVHSPKNQRIELKYIDKTFEDNIVDKIQKNKIDVESEREKKLSNL